MATFGSTVRVLQVPLEAASLNNGDVFILDNGLTVYQFNAPNSDSKERRRAMEIVQQDIREDRDGLPELTILDGDEVFSCDPFWELLGGKVDDLPDPESGRDTEITDDVNFSASKKLFKISDESGSLVLSLEKEAESVSEDDMNDEDVWVVACDGKCFIHIAENTSKDEKFYVWNSCGSVLLAAGLDETAPTTFFSKHSDASLWRSLFA